MNDIDHSYAAPLVRGLYLGVLGSPVAIAPVASEPVAIPESGRGVLEIDMPGAFTPGDQPGFDEKSAAASLMTAFASWRVGRDSRETPGAVVVTDGSTRVAYRPWVGADAPARPASRDSVVAGRCALVTGGAQGFGEEIVRGLAASGAIVFIADLNIAGAEKLASELNAAVELNSKPGAARGGPRAIAVAVNVTDPESVRAMFAAVAGATGGIDLVVSNAGVLKAGSVLEQDAASFRFVTDVNYTGFFHMAKYAGLLMRRQHRLAPRWRADIVQINSKSGLQGSNKNGAYAGSKFGGIGLVQSFALELVEYGIKVNAICPGNFFDGPLWSDPEKGLFVQYLRSGKVPGAKDVADVKAFYEAKVPMGRGCEGPDVMRALYYLVEQEYETGQALPVTGGQVMLN